MTELTDELIEKITRGLKSSINPLRIYLFGSYATGNVNDDSDIDLLAVIHDTKKSLREIAIQGKNSLGDFAIPLDLVVCTKYQFDRFRDVKNSIINEAFNFGRIIYGA